MRAEETFLLHVASGDWGNISEEQAVAIIEAVPFARGVDEEGNLIFVDADGKTLAIVTWLEVGIQLQIKRVQNDRDIDSEQSNDTNDNNRHNHDDAQQLIGSLVTAIANITHDDVLVTEI